MRIFACMASSLDGKIGPAGVDHFIAIGSRYDLENLISLRDEADGILFGASTFRAWPKIHRGNDPTKTAHHFIMSRSLNIDFNSELFLNDHVPVTLFSSSLQPFDSHLLPEHVQIVTTPNGPEQVDHILSYIEDCGIKSLMIEGGGQILHQFIDGKALQELFLTLVPAVIGDIDAPGLLGDLSLKKPPQVKVIKSKMVGDEIYLHLWLDYSTP